MTQPAPDDTTADPEPTTPHARYGAVDLPDCWGVDTAVAGALTDAQLEQLARTTLPNGKPVRFLWGYVPLPGNRSAWDMTGPRIRAACDAGLAVMLVQHCRSGTWVASEAQGRADGQHAAEYAAAQGYAHDAHLALDDEALRNAGPPVFASVVGWCAEVRAAALPCVYEGFDPGLSPGQEYAVPDVDRYWGAYGPWDVATRSVCCRQSLQIILRGIGGVDPDHAFPDKLGGVLRAMVRLDLWHP